jgi:hypothetical protein
MIESHSLRANVSRLSRQMGIYLTLSMKLSYHCADRQSNYWID